MTVTPSITLSACVVLGVVVLGETIAHIANTSPSTPGFIVSGLFIVIGLACISRDRM